MTVSAIAIPKLDLAINKAREARAVVELHSISVMVESYAAGNNGLFPNSLADIDCDKLKDPWGDPYRYTNLVTNSSSARQDQFGAAINTAFDLYSLGPDAGTAQSIIATTSQDDIIYANDGGYVGKASDY